MSKEMTVIVLGIWVVVVPYLGIPGAWRTALLVLTGIGIALVGFILRGEALGRPDRPGSAGSQHSTFVENTAQPTEAHEQKEGISELN